MDWVLFCVNTFLFFASISEQEREEVQRREAELLDMLDDKVNAQIHT